MKHIKKKLYSFLSYDAWFRTPPLFITLFFVGRFSPTIRLSPTRDTKEVFSQSLLESDDYRIFSDWCFPNLYLPRPTGLRYTWNRGRTLVPRTSLERDRDLWESHPNGLSLLLGIRDKDSLTDHIDIYKQSTTDRISSIHLKKLHSYNLSIN